MRGVKRLLLLLLLCLVAGGAARADTAESGAYDWATWRQFWSFKPVHRPAPPAVKGEKWVRNPIDRFVLARLEAEGLKPAAEADKLTLIRRLTFNLTGLQPTPEEIR